MSETEQGTTGIGRQQLDELKNDRQLALRAEKDIGEKAHPDAEDVDARTAVRYIGTFDGTPRYQVVTTKLTGFPIGSDTISEKTEDSVLKWADAHDPEFITFTEEDGFEAAPECEMPECVGSPTHDTHPCRSPAEGFLEMCDACLNAGWREHVEVLD